MVLGNIRFLNRRGGVPSGEAAFIAMVNELPPAISGKYEQGNVTDKNTKRTITNLREKRELI
jgi:hypothetical protein